MQYWFIMGTAAELIKVYPVLVELTKRNIDWWVWSTGQGSENFWMQYDDLALPRERAFCIEKNAQDLHSSKQAFFWWIRNFLRSKKSLLKAVFEKTKDIPQKQDYAVVHGDTLSTLLGAFFARRLGLRLAHIEAGMRSGDIFNPFPEEISRRIVSRFASLNFAPDKKAEESLRNEKVKGVIVQTHGNTAYDALITALQISPPSDIPRGKYIVANLHRFESLNSVSRWNVLIQTLMKANQIHPVYFVMHPTTEARLNRDPKSKDLLLQAGVQLLPRQSFSRFSHILSGAQFVLSDGGGNQKECAYLGIPCLIMREKVELTEGLEKNCVISEFKEDRVADFLKNVKTYSSDRIRMDASPASIISNTMAAERDMN